MKLFDELQKLSSRARQPAAEASLAASIYEMIATQARNAAEAGEDHLTVVLDHLYHGLDSDFGGCRRPVVGLIVKLLEEQGFSPSCNLETLRIDWAKDPSKA